MTAGYVYVADEVAHLLGCVRGLVDVLDSGPDYVAFSIFDYEGDSNNGAMEALEAISRHEYGRGDDDQILHGPVLLVMRH